MDQKITSFIALRKASHAKLEKLFWKANCQSWPKNCWTLWNWQNDVVVVASKFLIVDWDMMRMKLLTLCNWLQFICLALIIIYYTCITLFYYIYYLLYFYIAGQKVKILEYFVLIFVGLNKISWVPLLNLQSRGKCRKI